MEVYVLYGRVYFSEAVFDTSDNYFGESPVIEVFTNFESALKKLKEYAVVAYNHLRECSYIVDDSFIENTTEEDLFTNYNLGEEEDPIENNVCWEYEETEDSVYWQMTAKNIPWDEPMPILAGLHIRKVLVND